MEANDIVLGQKQAFEDNFSSPHHRNFFTHTTTRPLTRYLRDRRLKIGITYLANYLSLDISQIKDWEVLTVCGGAGGEALFFYRLGFEHVTNSDFSENALKACNSLEPRIKTVQLNAENLELADESFDLVVVQDGLHHLSRPVLGFTEMLRVARKAVIVIEPHLGITSRLLGKEWEDDGGVYNYVFRWDKKILEQVTKSYLLKNTKGIKELKVWDHSMAVLKIVNRFPDPMRLKLAKLIYGVLNILFSSFGNNMVGVVVKK